MLNGQRNLFAMLALIVFMAAVVALVSIGITDARGVALAARVVASVLAGVVTFAGVARALGVEELTVFTRQLLKQSK